MDNNYTRCADPDMYMSNYQSNFLGVSIEDLIKGGPPQPSIANSPDGRRSLSNSRLSKTFKERPSASEAPVRRVSVWDQGPEKKRSRKNRKKSDYGRVEMHFQAHEAPTFVTPPTAPFGSPPPAPAATFVNDHRSLPSNQAGLPDLTPMNLNFGGCSEPFQNPMLIHFPMQATTDHGFPLTFPFPPLPPPPIWAEYFSPDGTPYYYNMLTQVTTWEKPPPELIFRHEHHIPGGTYFVSQNGNITQEPLQNDIHIDVKNEKDCSTKPVSAESIPDSHWSIVTTNDNRVFFYNVVKKISEWDIPNELTSRQDVHQMIADVKQLIANARKNMETTSALNGNDIKEAPLSQAGNTYLPTEAVQGYVADTTIKVEKKKKKHLKPKTSASTKVTASVNEEKDIQIEAEKELSLDDVTSLKGIDISVAEKMASKKRNEVPYKERVKTFQQLLAEKSVSAFSTWEKELQKIVFDPRYLLLTSRERKSAFESYVAERAADEATEVQAQIKTAKDDFSKFVKTVLTENKKISYSLFEKTFATDPRMELLRNPKDRKSVFEEESLLQVIDAKSPSSEISHEKSFEDEISNAKDEFKDFLTRKVRDYHCKWKSISYKRYDRRFRNLESSEMKQLLRLHCQKLKEQKKGYQVKRVSVYDVNNGGKQEKNKARKGRSSSRRHQRDKEGDEGEYFSSTEDEGGWSDRDSYDYGY